MTLEGLDSEEDAEYGDFEDLEADGAEERETDEDVDDEEEAGPLSTSGNRPPTRDELRSIKEASELYKSNTFKLAVSNLNDLHNCLAHELLRLMKCYQTFGLRRLGSKQSRSFCVNCI